MGIPDNLKLVRVARDGKSVTDGSGINYPIKAGYRFNPSSEPRDAPFWFRKERMFLWLFRTVAIPYAGNS